MNRDARDHLLEKGGCRLARTLVCRWEREVEPRVLRDANMLIGGHTLRTSEYVRPARTARSQAGALALLLLGLCSTAQAQSSLRYYGGASGNQVDRVKIQIDELGNSNPGPPVDVGDTDFTIELFLRAPVGSNLSGNPGCGFGAYNWIDGNIFLDRDRYGQGREFGLSLGGGRVYFGINGAQGSPVTICGMSNLIDGQWHHVAVQRRRSDGWMWLYVDGVLEDEADGPNDDLSYPDDGAPTNNCGGPCDESEPFLVIGAEKHDQAGGFDGWVDELRVSTALRYSGSFTPPGAPFAPDASTAALYHFDEGVGNVIVDSTPGNQSPGVRYYGLGGGAQPGPDWSTDTPFGGVSAGAVQFSTAASNVNESAATATLDVTRTGGSSGAASVNYQVTGGTATSGADYAPLAAGTLNWADGDATPRSVTINLMDDATDEPAETIVLQLSNATGATLGTPTAVTLTINDDDSAPGGDGGGGGALDWLVLAVLAGGLEGLRRRTAKPQSH